MTVAARVPALTGPLGGGELPPLAARRKSRRVGELVIETLLRVSAFAAVLGLALIMVFLFREALPVFFDPVIRHEAGFQHFISTIMWQPVGSVPKYGILPLIVGTLKVVVIAMMFAVPIGVLAAVFASEFASPRLREALKPVIEILAGIPSVVLGFFALIVMASWVQAVTGAASRLNALNAGIALALGIIPVIFTVCEDALRAVPRSYREASLALGATTWRTAWAVTLPAASAGVAAGILLGLARAVGETMIVLMASGNAAIVSGNPLDSVRTLSATIAAELAEVVVGGPHYSVLFFLGALLFTTTFCINVAAGMFVDRLRKQLRGA